MPNEEARTLTNTKVRRKASTAGAAHGFSSAADAVLLHTGYSDSEERQLWLTFQTSASGGTLLSPGRTDYRILIDAADYAAILKAMCDVDEDVALSAMADELAARLKT